MADNLGAFPSLQTVAKALGGEISNGQVLAPGPGHSAADRSLCVKLDTSAPGGFLVHSFSPVDDPILCRDFVREKVGLPAFRPNGNGRQRVSDDVIERAVMEAVAGQGHNNKPKGRIVAQYNYTDATGKLLYQVVRLEPKDFRQRRPNGNGGWIWRLDERRVLYRWPELIKFPDATVFVTEGEKDADRVAELNLCATTVAAGKWTDDCVKALAGRDVVILEDNDTAGREKALKAATVLHDVAKTVRVVSLPDLPHKGDVSDWLDADPRRADKLADVCFDVPVWVPTVSSGGNTAAREEPETPAVTTNEAPSADLRGSAWNYHSDAKPVSPRWLIKNILPETGVAIESGQWGVFKTTAALDMSVCVMAELPFADRYKVKRRGAVLYFALEGQGAVQTRLSAIAAHRGATGPLPFAWRGDCPPLVDKNAADLLCRFANEAAADLKHRFGLPVVLIWVDTLITAAGYGAGEENDAAASQKVMSALRGMSQHTGALVVGIDHFGKVMETGTRGSSAKEGSADAVIALLADRELSGGVKNTRLAVRKQRDGLAGQEIPFTVKAVETGTDEDDEPITAPVINWHEAQKPSDRDSRWTPSMRLLRNVLTAILADIGQDVRPFSDGPLVRACDIEAVRAEFYKQHAADGTDKQKADARRKAFGRSLKGSQASGLVATREVAGTQLIWLVKPDDANA